MAQQLRNEIPGGGNDEHPDKNRLSQGKQNSDPAFIRCAGEDRRQEHHGDHSQILKDENADRSSSMDRVAVPPFGQRLQHDRRAAQGKKEPPEHPLPPGQSEEYRPEPRDQQHDTDLDRRGQKHESPHGRQLHQREFDADGEKEQNDPDLGQYLNRLDIRDEVQPVGTDERPGNQKSGDRGKSELVKHEDDGNRRCEDHEEIRKHAVVRHGRNRLGVRSERGRR